jgi:predicted MPP superfamily phosphohydrolase
MLMTITCLTLLAFSAYYVPLRLKRLWGFKRARPLQLAALLLLGGYYGMLVKGIYTWPNSIAAAFYNGLGLFFIFQVYLFMILLAGHILNLFFKKIPGKGLAVASVLIGLGFVGFGFFQAQSFTVTAHEIQVRGLAKPVSLMHIPDLHLGAQRGEIYLQAVIEAINSRLPDLVIYNGDLVDSNIALRPELFALFKSVRAEQYFTTGNHEFYLDTDRALKLIAGVGIRIVRSEMVETHGLQFIGLEYMNADRVTYDSHMVNALTIEEELPKIPRSPALPVLLAHHSPVGVQYVSQGNVDVMLSGHTHGGQVFPGPVLTGIRFPMNKGRYTAGGTAILVSQGAGTFGPWMRLGTFNELQFITLSPAE